MSFPRFRSALLTSFFPLFCLAPLVSGADEKASTREVRLTIDTRRPIASFDPRNALGAGLDGHSEGDTLQILSPANLQRMLQAGLGPISLRLRTELAVEAWHWNPHGTWSDPAHEQGYWTSANVPQRGKPILFSYGYKLPRRGNTNDEANDDGYSRLDDGNLATFWKSNPYLAQPFTGEPDSVHPGWVVIDFEKPVPLNAVRIAWAAPYAKKFEVEYALRGCVDFGDHPRDVWHTFDHGRRLRGVAGPQLVRLSDRPVMARYLRVWMTESSGTAAPGSHDLRDRLGYAIREISAGWCDDAGTFHDEVVHARSKHQSSITVSSTDPWHRASDRDPGVEQPGLDLVFRSAITRGLPVMLAVPVLYDTPDNTTALAEYAKTSGYTVGRYELGEEPDGQRGDARDFGALYAPVAGAIRRLRPEAIIGGPSFVTGDHDYFGITYQRWIQRFRQALARRGQNRDLNFLSFESYPFNDVHAPEEKQLPEAAWKLNDSLTRLKREHLPIIIGEFNYSAYSTEHEVDLGGAMLNAETAAQFLCTGGEAAYYYGYEPVKLERTEGAWGNQAMLLQTGAGEVVPLATFHALRMLTNDWLAPKGGPHRAFQVRMDLPQPVLNRLSAFAVRRPDDSWSLLVINKDTSCPVRLSIDGLPVSPHPASLVTYSSNEYRWHSAGPHGRPLRNDPPVRQTVRIDRPVTIPAWSISVLQAR